jgi:hypothetical protein
MIIYEPNRVRPAQSLQYRYIFYGNAFCLACFYGLLLKGQICEVLYSFAKFCGSLQYITETAKSEKPNT